MRRALQTMDSLMQRCEDSHASVRLQLHEIGGIRHRDDFDETGWKGTVTPEGLSLVHIQENYQWSETTSLNKKEQDPDKPWFSPAGEPTWTGSRFSGQLAWETDMSAAMRAKSCVDWLEGMQQEYEDDQVVVMITHPRFASLLLQHLLNMPPSSQAFINFQLDDGSASCVHLPRKPLQQYNVLFLNRVQHLGEQGGWGVVGARENNGSSPVIDPFEGVVGPVSRL
jgi:broad specificity phosphatase PhoE